MKRLLRSALFRDISEEEARKLAQTDGWREVSFDTGAQILTQGDPIEDIGFLEEGKACGVRTEPDGREYLLSEFAPGSFFGEILSGATVNSPVSVRAQKDCKVLFLPLDRLLESGADCPASVRTKRLRNFITLISDQYFEQNRRLMILTAGRIERRTARYLVDRSGGKEVFELPHNREEMSRQLGCDRSALSRVLSEMRKKGIVEYRRSRFRILDLEQLRRLAFFI